MGEPHPAVTLDELVHQRARLGILTVLAEAGRSDFPYLRRTLELTDGNLGRHLEVLADAGLIEMEKGFEGRRPRTWARITTLGRQALVAQLETLRQLIDRVHSDPQRHAVHRSPTTQQ